MQIEDLNENQFVDLFPESTNTVQPRTAKFGNEQTETNILGEKPADTPPGDTLTDAPDTTILGKEETTTSPDLSLTNYFQERIKSGMFVPIEDESEDGTKTEFVPKTAEEFDEIINLQINHKLDEKRKELEEGWYNSKSRAWQAIAQFAEMTDDPSEILPFLSGVKNIESVSDLNPDDADAAEKIVRMRLVQRGEEESMIEEQIEALKTTNKLVSTATKYKPAILQQEQQELKRLTVQKQQEKANYINMVNSIKERAIQAIDAPLFGKPLKREDQAAIYDMIAEPDQESRGYRIFSKIDELFETGNFEKLKKVALLLENEDSLVSYIGNSASNKTAADLQKKLRVAAEFRTSRDNEENERPSIQRKKYSGKFGQ